MIDYLTNQIKVVLPIAALRTFNEIPMMTPDSDYCIDRN